MRSSIHDCVRCFKIEKHPRRGILFSLQHIYSLGLKPFYYLVPLIYPYLLPPTSYLLTYRLADYSCFVPRGRFTIMSSSAADTPATHAWPYLLSIEDVSLHCNFVNDSADHHD